MSKKALFFDADGTLVGESRKVTQKNIDALRQVRANGHLVFLCTGRAPASVDQDLLDVGFDGIVASAGSLVYINGEYVFENFINQYLLGEVMTLFTNNNVMFSLECRDQVYQAPGMNKFFKARMKETFKDNLELVRAMEDRKINQNRRPLKEFDMNTTPVMKLCFIASNKEDFDACIPYLSEFFNIVIFSKPEDDYINGEIIQKHCTKGDGVKYVCQYYDIPLEDSYAFGDSMNDYEMLQVAAHSYVSELSADNLKEIADDIFVVPDNDGIYKLLDKLGLLDDKA